MVQAKVPAAGMLVKLLAGIKVPTHSVILIGTFAVAPGLTVTV